MKNHVAPFEYDSLKVTFFERNIRSFEIAMTLLGTWPIRSTSCAIHWMHTVYALLIMLSVIYFFVVLLGNFIVRPGLDKLSATLVIVEIWFFQVIVCRLIFYWTKRSNEYLPRFFQQLDEYLIAYARSYDEIKCHLLKMKKKVWSFIIIFNLICLSTISLILTRFKTLSQLADSFDGIYSFPFTKQQTFGYNVQPLLHNMAILVLLESAMFGTAIFVMIAGILIHEFDTFNHDLSLTLADKDHLESSRLEALRWRHERLRELVEQADRTFGKYLATNYVASIPLLCFVFYQIIYKSIDAEMTLTMSSFTLVMAIQMSFITYFAVRLAEKTPERLRTLFSAKADHRDHNIVLQLLFLAESIKGPFIGFSLWNIVSVSKETILTFLGAILTYIVMVADYQK